MIWNHIIKANCAPESGQLGESCNVLKTTSLRALYSTETTAANVQSKKLDNDSSHLIQSSFVIQTHSCTGQTVFGISCKDFRTVHWPRSHPKFLSIVKFLIYILLRQYIYIELDSLRQRFYDEMRMYKNKLNKYIFLILFKSKNTH